MVIQAISSPAAYELTNLVQSQGSALASKQAPVDMKKARGASPAGVSGPPKPAAASESTASSSDTTKIYDVKDANKDGTVSYNEETQSQPAVTTNQLQTGLNAYQQGNQANKTTISSLLSAG
jgi:hypothetical protein